MARKVIDMTERVVGPTGSWRRRWTVLFTLLIAVGVSMVVLNAVHDTGRFQLDGDADTDTTAVVGMPAATDDWDKVCFQVAVRSTALGGGGLDDAAAATKCGIGVPTTGATGTTWVAELDPSASIFTGGGSKDPIDISDWAWKDAGGLPDKDNLLHAYAARYTLTAGTTCPSGGTATTCDVIFFGSDRRDNSGDAQSGFWFLQNPVTLGSTPLGGGSNFEGVHAAGDILVISDFSNGGTTSTITIYKWDPTCKKAAGTCGDTNLRRLESSDNSKCKPGTATGDSFCGIVNPSTIIMPWEFVDKSGTLDNQALNGEFYEAGINLSKLGLANECFSSVVSETRSSTSTNAVLKDFVVGQFAVCHPDLTTQASATLAAPVNKGIPVHDTATVTVTGGSGSSTVDPTGTVTFFLCGPIASGDCSTGSTGYTPIGTGVLVGGTLGDGVATAVSLDVNCAVDGTGCFAGKNPLATGRYCFRATWPGDTRYPTPLAETNATSECFAVKDTSTTTTAQSWLPQDEATVKLSDGTTNGVGSVTFSLYTTTACTGDPVTFGPVNLVNGVASTSNTSYYTLSQTVSWRVTFTSTDPTVDGSTSNCEQSSVTINNVGVP